MRPAACVTVVLVLTAMPCRTGATAAETSGWRVLSDTKGSRVDYPADVFSVAETPHEGVGGLRFKTADGRADFSFFSVSTPRATSPARYLARHLRLPEQSIQYRRTTPSFFAVSGTYASDVYYARCNSSVDHAMLHCIYMSYPAAETRDWDAIVTRISLSLHS